MIPQFIARKHDATKIQYACPELKPILQSTYGTILYQEQIMRIAQDLGGYTLGQADLLRRAMGKKKKEEMEKHRNQFIDGAAKNGVNQTVANDLFEQMVVFAEYCFNKSHSIAYGFVTYQTAYLKANYPVEYLAALLSSVKGDQDKVQKYLADCNSIGVRILPPDVNRSDNDFTPVGAEILFGLGAVKNVGESVVEEIIREREKSGPFKSLADLCSRLTSANKRSIECLIKTGALDFLHSNRNQMLSDLEPIMDWAAGRVKERQVNLFDMMTAESSIGTDFDSAPAGPKVEDFPEQEKLKYEKELLGFYVSDHPLKAIQEEARLLAPINLSDLADFREESSISVLALLTELKSVVTKKGDRMAILFLEDLTGSVEAVVFPKVFELINSVLIPDQRLLLWGKVDRKDDRVQLIINDAEPVEQVSLVVVDVDIDYAKQIENQHRLKTLLTNNQAGENGKVPVVLRINYQQQSRFVRLGPQFRIHDPQAMIQSLRPHFHAELKQLVTHN
jgi:DNA polymerase III subunit alpha